MQFRVDHVHLYAADLEATAEWYRRVLGAQVLRSRQSDGRVRTDLLIGELTLYLGDAKKLEKSLGWRVGRRQANRDEAPDQSQNNK
jgi:catechol 2,3-dioxygenase-like lactoylglutathione lyase family enzyme